MVKRRIVQYSKEMEPLRTFESIQEAQEYYHITHISGVCRRKRASDGGYIWRYEEEAESAAEIEKERNLREQMEKRKEEYDTPKEWAATRRSAEAIIRNYLIGKLAEAEVEEGEEAEEE